MSRLDDFHVWLSSVGPSAPSGESVCSTSFRTSRAPSTLPVSLFFILSPFYPARSLIYSADHRRRRSVTSFKSRFVQRPSFLHHWLVIDNLRNRAPTHCLYLTILESPENVASGQRRPCSCPLARPYRKPTTGTWTWRHCHIKHHATHAAHAVVAECCG